MTHSRRAFLQLSAVGAATLVPGSIACGRWSMASGTLEKRFIAAAKAGDLDSVKDLLATRSDLLTSTDPEGRSAYALTLLNHHPNLASYLLEQGYSSDAHEAALAGNWERFTALTENDVASVNQSHPIGGTMLFAAATGGTGSALWRVYGATGDVNAIPNGSLGISPLQAALRYPDLAAAEMTAATLLANNADPNPSQRAEDGPLHIAAHRGSEVIAEMLVRLGASVESKNRDGLTANQIARRAGQDRIVNLLANHKSILRTHSTSRTAYDASGAVYAPPDIGDIPMPRRSLFVGVSHANLEAVARDLERDERMAHSVATTSEICVEACAHTGRRQIVDLLLEHGAPYSLPTAVMRNDRARVATLLDQDPLRINERGAHDFALLWYPLIGNCGIEMMEMLLERGADIEQQHFMGTTALHWACMRGDIDVARLLIEKSANIHRQGHKFGAAQTPLQIALKRDHEAVARLLKQHGAKA